MRLTPHFTMGELVASDTALRMGIDNTPQAQSVTDNLFLLAEVLELIREALGAPVICASGYRCEDLERVLTGKDFAAWCERHQIQPDKLGWRTYFKRKAHPQGRAADFTAPQFGTPAQIVKAIAARPDIMAKIDQIIMEGGWVHVAIGDNPRGEVLTAIFTDGAPRYSKGVE